jgi:putative Holliday junction resolvase
MSDANPTGKTIPTSGRLLGIDVGSVRIGLAICDAAQTMAGPLATYVRRSEELDAEYFRKLVKDERIVGLVIGLPLHLSGRDSAKSQEVQRFARWLNQITNCPFAFYDERFSTAQADELIGGELTRKQRKARIDKIAAQIILASYLESDRRQGWEQAIDE